MEQVVAIGKPSYKNLAKENKEAFYKDYVLIQQIIKWKQNKQSKISCKEVSK